MEMRRQKFYKNIRGDFIMSEKQVMIKILEKMPDDITFDDIVETLNLIYELRNRIDTFDRSKALTTEELKREIKTW